MKIVHLKFCAGNCEVVFSQPGRNLSLYQQSLCAEGIGIILKCSGDQPWIPDIILNVHEIYPEFLYNSEFSGDLPWIYNVIWIFRRSSLKSWLSSQRSGHISWTPDIFLNVQEIYPEFLRRFVERTSQLKVGDPLDETVFMGAVNR